MSALDFLSKVGHDLICGTAHENYTGLRAVDVPDYVRKARQKADEEAARNRQLINSAVEKLLQCQA